MNKSNKEINDEVFYDTIDKTNTLAKISKTTYTRKLIKITTTFFQKKVSIWWVIHHPDEFRDAAIKYRETKKIAPSTLAQYIIPIIFCITYYKDIQENDPKLKYIWLRMRNEIKELNDEIPCTDNIPTKKQQEGFIPFEEICQIRDALPDGSYSRLLLSMYTLIKPVRSDFDNVRLYIEEPENNTGNYIVLGKINKLFLNEYKTSNLYDENIIDLPKELVNQIKISLKKYPREYLFVDHTGSTYNSPNTFNKWANKLIKNTLDNPFITLTMLRHIYLSQPSLHLEEKTLKERKEIARQMCHSVETQKKYVLNNETKEEPQQPQPQPQPQQPQPKPKPKKRSKKQLKKTKK